MDESLANFNRLVEQVFQNHYDFHGGIGVDFIKSDSGHINQVSSDYQGRVLYELLQNAFDRAEDKILVKVIGKSLFVANDGKQFTYNAQHDYKDGGVEVKHLYAAIFNHFVLYQLLINQPMKVSETKELDLSRYMH